MNDSALASARWAAIVVLVGAVLAACGSHGSSGPQLPQSYKSPFTSPPTSPATQSPVNPGDYIKHVVIIVQENRSFDNLFQGYPGADTSSTGLKHNGQTVQLQPVPLEASYDVNHMELDFLNSYDGGKMDGFDLVGTTGGSPPQNPQYGYVPANESATYFGLAKQFVVADRMFSSQIDASFTAHQFLISAQSDSTVDNPNAAPWGCDAPGGTTVPTINSDRTQGPGIFPCFNDLTLGDELDGKGLPWRYYAPPINGGDLGGRLWTAYDAIRQIRYGPDWSTNVVSPPSQILDDIPAGFLGAVTWVIPDSKDSDHSGSNHNSGPAWVSSIVDAIGTSQFWDTTAILLVWDDWGGWYDHVAPPQIDTQGLGIRIPLVVISPYAKANYVSHVSYESAGLLKFAETVFSLAPLTNADLRANALDDCFNFTQQPRSFQSIRRHLLRPHFVRHAPSMIPPDNG